MLLNLKCFLSQYFKLKLIIILTYVRTIFLTQYYNLKVFTSFYVKYFILIQTYFIF